MPNAEDRILVFLARTHAGFTRKLASYCANNVDGQAVSAWIDGPYGGIDRPVERLFGTIVLVAGGAGITACMPMLSHVVMRSGVGHIETKRIVLVWAVREVEHFTWVGRELKDVLALSGAAGDGTGTRSEVSVEVRLYVTRNRATTAASRTKTGGVDEKKSDIATSPTEDTLPVPGDLAGLCLAHPGRPVVGGILREQIGAGKTLVVGCGPANLRDDVANACAREQARVLRGEIQEVAMHLEVFGW